MRNLELKAVAGDFSRLRKTLRALGARREPHPLHQTDWYFEVPKGRLKLRRRTGESTAELIFYCRPDAKRARASEYQKLAVADVAGMLRLLRSMLSAGPIVRKRRELWWCGETRVHLDRVAGLGSFVEIEMPFARRATEVSHAMKILRRQLGIGRDQLLARSYSDLLARSQARPE